MFLPFSVSHVFLSFQSQSQPISSHSGQLSLSLICQHSGQLSLSCQHSGQLSLMSGQLSLSCQLFRPTTLSHVSTGQLSLSCQHSANSLSLMSALWANSLSLMSALRPTLSLSCLSPCLSHVLVGQLSLSLSHVSTRANSLSLSHVSTGQTLSLMSALGPTLSLSHVSTRANSLSLMSALGPTLSLSCQHSGQLSSPLHVILSPSLRHSYSLSLSPSFSQHLPFSLDPYQMPPMPKVNSCHVLSFLDWPIFFPFVALSFITTKFSLCPRHHVSLFDLLSLSIIFSFFLPPSNPFVSYLPFHLFFSFVHT
ncbi:unnamed protein product [Acanthosepion pharaonis]|uniref:Uncharacterized protein n=1 Tax=Acanthosepion pharaonis TaxID=158019 RepID=A0A812EYI4_ACAPH|nr:unnamed protein product [Sepia pharaonis]